MKTRLLKQNDRSLAKTSVKILRSGGMIIYPTETLYGIGANASNEKAVKKVFAAKKRPQEKKVTWAFSDIAMIKKSIKTNKIQEQLIRKAASVSKLKKQAVILFFPRSSEW